MRSVLVLGLLGLLLLTACGSNQRRSAGENTTLHRYGIKLQVPDGWDATLAHGAVRAANFPLPPPRGRPLGKGHLLLQLFETDLATDSPTPEGAVPTLAADDFRAPESGAEQVASLARRRFSVSGRLFVLFASSGSAVPPPRALDELDQLLASISIERGDFYPGSVEPPRFARRDGWFVGGSGRRPVLADGRFVSAWASTKPYRDSWNTPHADETLRTLPDDGIVIWIGLFTTNRSVPPAALPGPDVTLPLHLAQFERRATWEGQVRDLPEYLLWARVDGRYEVDARVFFGRPLPTPAMEREADAMLAALQLPDWPPLETG